MHKNVFKISEIFLIFLDKEKKEESNVAIAPSECTRMHENVNNILKKNRKRERCNGNRTFRVH
jgi:ribosomal protein L16 Arg81 hydroxylase